MTTAGNATMEARIAALEKLVTQMQTQMQTSMVPAMGSMNTSLSRVYVMMSGSAPIDTGWIVLCGTLILLMQVGFAMLESGMVRENNVIATLSKNLFDFILGTLVCCHMGRVPIPGYI
jgi:hypothetical protein